MPTETLVESRSKHLKLDQSVAEALRTAGRELASRASWWGADADPADEESPERTVISCAPSGTGQYDVTVKNENRVLRIAKK